MRSALVRSEPAPGAGRRDGQEGVALVGAMVVIFALTVIVAALAASTMIEVTLAHDQMRAQRALAAAEAGAYRALVELRRRIEVDLGARLEQSGEVGHELAGICRSKEPVPPVPGAEMVGVIARFAYPTAAAASDWVVSGGTAILGIGTPEAPVIVRDRASGAEAGRFHAAIAVRWSGRPATCRFEPGAPEQALMWFDHAIVAFGRSGNATRAVCLRSPYSERCSRWFPSVGREWQGSHLLSAGAYGGWPLLAERPAYSQWALATVNSGGPGSGGDGGGGTGDVWLSGGTVISGPLRFDGRAMVAGNPVLDGDVHQSDGVVRLLNCGSSTDIAIPARDPNAALRTACDNTEHAAAPVFRGAVRGNVALPLRPEIPNPSRAAAGLSGPGPDATDAQLRDATGDDERLGIPGELLPDGLYVIDGCGRPRCGGVYIKGDVQEMALSSEGGLQVVRIRIGSDPSPQRRTVKVAVDPTTGALTLYWERGGGDAWAQSHSYPAGTFNGLIYVSGGIVADPRGEPGGLYGVVSRATRLTIAARRGIDITDHLVYEEPPAGPGHAPANVLGLHSVAGDVAIDGALSPHDVYLDASIIAPAGRLWVRGFDSVPLRGRVYLLGALLQARMGAFGLYDPLSGPVRGYGRSIAYDWRLRSTLSPPFFPIAGSYTAARGARLSPLCAGGDPLYDRPYWEEMAGRK